MPVKPTYPGVYVEEIPSGVRTITGVSTSIALFVGRAKQGPFQKPTLCLSFPDYVRNFSDDTTVSEMTGQVRLFFENGGTRCYVTRIANGARRATVGLRAEDGATGVLVLSAKDPGLVGETIRVAVTYNGPQPESTFNLEVFRWEATATGQLVKAGQEVWSNLSMNPDSARYVVGFLDQNSKLINAAKDPGLPANPGVPGFSRSGRLIEYDNSTPTTLRSAFAGLLGQTQATNNFSISVNGAPYVDVVLLSLDVGGMTAASVAAFKTALSTGIQNLINNALPLGNSVTVTIPDGPAPAAAAAPNDTTCQLSIESATGDVYIRPASSNDLAVPLMLGTDQGGLEVSRFAAWRPAANGITFEARTDLNNFAGLQQNAFNRIDFGPAAADQVSLGNSLQTTGAAARMYQDGHASSPNGNSDGVREKLALMAQAVNDHAAATAGFNWQAQVWGSRLALIPTGGGDNLNVAFATANATNIAAQFANNVRYYSLGVSGTGSFQVPAPGLAPDLPAGQAADGTPPNSKDYSDAYQIVDKEVDLFNLLILPADNGAGATPQKDLYGPASVFCQKRRAFLLMDAPTTWTDVQKAVSPSGGVSSLRVGLVSDHSAIFYPRLLVNDNGLQKKVGPSGAIAGLMARTDSNRGVWKAPAGTEAGVRGIRGLEYLFSDDENGVLNPKAINTLRGFPTGIVNWGARTMDGDDDFGSEWKYIPVRRIALFIEESLYRGTKWIVFEPNDEPLWAQIRLNVGAFMNNLFRQGAFQGSTPRDAYLVKCDSETTTQNDINLGIVNILVGFAPLKPAEFVIIKIQQLAGQIQT